MNFESWGIGLSVVTYKTRRGGHPEWHIMGDVLPLINGDCKFQTQDGKLHEQVGRWDMLIAFPPCTYLTAAGAVRMFVKGQVVKERYIKCQSAVSFFLKFFNANCDRIAIENPVPMAIAKLPPYTQIIQPFQFGHCYSKRTCLWLKDLNPLVPTDIVRGDIMPFVSAGSKRANGTPRQKVGVSHNQKERSKTFPGIARAMAEQWGNGIISTKESYQMCLDGFFEKGG